MHAYIVGQHMHDFTLDLFFHKNERFSVKNDHKIILLTFAM